MSASETMLSSRAAPPTSGPLNSTQRTYRYVRLSIVGAVIALGVAMLAVSASGVALSSVSASYYSPARDVFVGVIFAVTLALVALSGRSAEQALLDYMAILAPLIALVPTPIAPSFSGVDCGTSEGVAAVCVPAQFSDRVGVGLTVFLAVAGIGIATAWVLAIVQQTLSRASGAAMAGAAILVAGIAVWWSFSPMSFLAGAHGFAAASFFSLLAVVSVLAAIGAHRKASTRRRAQIFRSAYTVIAVGISVSVAALLSVVVLDIVGIDLSTALGVPLVLVGEVVILGLFAAFWMVQTVHLWRDPDAPYVAPSGAPIP